MPPNKRHQLVLVAGSVAIAAGVYWWLTSPHEDTASSPSVASPEKETTSDIENLGAFNLPAVAARVEGIDDSSSSSSDAGSATNKADAWIEPSQYKCFVKTFGCTHNTSDSEVLRGVLQAAGFKLCDSVDDADVVVLNSCTVKNPSQDGAVNLALKCRRKGKHVVIGGCVVQADTKIPELDGFSCIGVKQLDLIAEAVFETIKGNVYKALATNKHLPSLSLPRIRKNRYIEIIPLSTGCLGACTYCKTRYARGVLGSYDLEGILARVRQAVNDGCQQIWFSSEDTGAYGLDLGFDIGILMTSVTNTLRELNSDIVCRLGMTNPPYMLAHLPVIAEAFNSGYWFKFLHIPVQSGSDTVLKNMNREYTRAEFEKCADTLLGAVDGLTLATDFICGFPMETDADHQESLTLIEKYKFPVINITQFYSRPRTAAAAMPKVNSAVVKKRSTEMTHVFHGYTTFDHFVGQVKEVYVDDVSERSNHVVGRTIEYVKVLLDAKHDVGKKYLVRIDKATKWHLEGQVIN